MSDNIFGCLYAIFIYADYSLQELTSRRGTLGRDIYTCIWYKGEIRKPWDGTSFFAIFFGAHRPSALAGDRPESFVSEIAQYILMYVHVLYLVRY